MEGKEQGPSAMEQEDAPSVVKLVVKWKRQTFEVEMPLVATVFDLRLHLYTLTQVQPLNQKLLIKSKVKLNDELTIQELGLKKHSFMMIGTPEKQLTVFEKADEEFEEAVDAEDDVDYVAEPEEKGVSNSNPSTVTPAWLVPENKALLEKSIADTELHMLCKPRKGKKLLVLDLDYTLFDMKVMHIEKDYRRLERPFTKSFLAAVYPFYDIVVWSQTSMKWLQRKLDRMELLSTDLWQIMCLVDKTPMFQITSGSRTHSVKPLQILWESKELNGLYGPHNTIHIDDLSRNFAFNPGNGLKISPYKKSYMTRHTDRELFMLMGYLVLLCGDDEVKDYSSVDHRKWKRYAKRHWKRLVDQPTVKQLQEELEKEKEKDS